MPEEVAPALLWGDAGPHNLLVADGRITALLDWELAHLGHPLEDLGAAQWACFDVLDPDAILGGLRVARRPGRPRRAALVPLPGLRVAHGDAARLQPRVVRGLRPPPVTRRPRASTSWPAT